jgi:hypothetical protein
MAMRLLDFDHFLARGGVRDLLQVCKSCGVVTHLIFSTMLDLLPHHAIVTKNLIV